MQDLVQALIHECASAQGHARAAALVGHELEQQRRNVIFPLFCIH